MHTRLPSLTYYLTRLLLLVLGVMLLYFLVGSAMRMADNQKQARRLEAAQAKLLEWEARKAELERQLEYINTEAAVVLWARRIGLARSNEVPVILVEPSGLRASEAAPAEEATAVAPRGGLPDGERREGEPETWWELLFGP